MSAFSRAGSRSRSVAADVLPPIPSERRGAPVVSRVRRADVLDAEFEVVTPGMGTRHPVFNDNRPSPARVPGPAGQRPAGGLQALEARLGRVSRRGFALMTAAACLASFLLAASVFSPAQRPTSTLSFGAVTTGLADLNGMRVVAVYGSVVNRTGQSTPVPPIRVDLVSGTGMASAEAQLAETGPIPPGGSRRFSARLPHAGGPAPEAKISFAQAGAPRP